jgi:hypothetical protein
MRTLLLTGAAALSLAAVPFTALVAQDSSAPAASTTSVTMTAEQQAMYDTWPADKQATFVTWTPVYQGYYWTLTPSQAEAYWLLSDEQRAQINGMTPAQRTIAWTSIERQVAGAPTANEANAAAAPVTETTVATQIASDGQPQAVVTTSTGNLTPPPASAQNKEYPVCRGAVQDSCVNPREAGLNYGNRPLKEWPGEPASANETGG